MEVLHDQNSAQNKREKPGRETHGIFQMLSLWVMREKDANQGLHPVLSPKAVGLGKAHATIVGPCLLLAMLNLLNPM